MLETVAETNIDVGGGGDGGGGDGGGDGAMTERARMAEDFFSGKTVVTDQLVFCVLCAKSVSP